MKNIFLFTLVATIAILELTVAENAEWGQMRPGDRQLFREIVHKKGSFLKVVTQDVEYKSPYNFSYIKVTDQYTNGNGGYATLYDGGVGFNHVKLHLKSQRGHGFNFIIEIYG